MTNTDEDDVDVLLNELAQMDGFQVEGTNDMSQDDDLDSLAKMVEELNEGSQGDQVSGFQNMFNVNLSRNCMILIVRSAIYTLLRKILK